MKEIDEKILNYCGIYRRPEVDEKTRREILKKKKDIETLTGIKIERVYLYGKSYWGKNGSKKCNEICFLSDVRIEDLNKGYQKILEYDIHTSILYWSLAQFEKRCQSTRELDYYISRYGALIYDSGKQTEIDENIIATQYASTVSNYNYSKRYLSEENGVLMSRLLEMYLLKIGYYSPERYEDIIEYVEYVNEDKTVTEILERYKKEEDYKKRDEICKGFELYIKNNVKERIKHYKLKKQPTMKVYEKLEKRYNENGPLDIKTLTKEDLYIMYILQQKNSYEIAKLYDVSTRKITEKRNAWKIKLKEEVINIENVREMLKMGVEKHGRVLTYASFKKIGLMSFEECIMPILSFMRKGDTFLLKEFWRFTEFEKSSLEEQLIGENTTTLYRATFCTEFLKDNGLIEEVDFKKYRITKKGKEIVKYYNYHVNQKKPIMEFLIRRLKEIDLFGIIYDDKNEFKYIDTEIERQENKDLEIFEEDQKQIYIEEINEEKSEKEEIDIEEQINNIKEIKYVKKEKKKSTRTHKGKKVKRDYVKETEAKTAFGKKCENIIYEKEKRKLIKQGREDLAKKVEWVSQQPGGDSKGYDIISFRKINNKFEKIYIEVKGTNKDYDEDFEISTLEVETSEEYGDSYYLCRVAKGNSKQPVYYEEKGSITKNYELKPTVYRASKKE